MGKWIKISDRKPFNGQSVYYFFKHTGVSKGKYKSQSTKRMDYVSDIFYGDGGYLMDDVSHWMDVGDSLDTPEEPES